MKKLLLNYKAILKAVWTVVSVGMILLFIYLAPDDKWAIRILLLYLYVTSDLNQTKLDKIRKDLNNQASIMAGWIRMKPPKNMGLS